MAELQIVAGKEEHKYYPFTGIYYANRHSFWSAGQDSWTLPPTQNPDMFQQLINVEPVLQGILQRRRGYTLFAPGVSALATGNLVPIVATSTGSGTAWNNPSNVLALDGQSASVTVASNSHSQHLQATGFGFAVPVNAFVTNVAVSITSSQTAGGGPFQPLQSLTLALISGGLTIGSVFFQPTSQNLTTQVLNFSGPTPAEINDPTFGVDLLSSIPLGFQGDSFNVDAITVRVSYSLQAPYTLGYSFRSELLGLREVVFTSPFNIQVLTEAGAPYISSLFIPSLGASRPRMMLSRSYGYFADGIQADYKKWNGTTGGPNFLTNWGINVNNITVAGATFGPNGPTTATNLGPTGGNQTAGPNSSSVAVDDATVGNLTWHNTTNVFVQDGQYANTSSGAVGDSSHYLNATGFGFNIPGNATIQGILINALVKNSTGSDGVRDSSIKIVKGGVISGTDQAAGNTWTQAPVQLSWGGSSNLWGLTWTPADINAPNFGVAISATFLSISADTANIDNITCTVFYSTPINVAWSNPNNILAQDSLTATAALSPTQSAADLQATGFGFSLPTTASITGIKVEILASVSPGTSCSLTPILTKNGASTGTRKQVVINSSSLQFVSLGGISDLWDGSWSPTDINGAQFGVQFGAIGASATSTVAVDFVRITVFTGAGPLALGTPGVGNITLLNGRTYFYAFENSLTGHTSSLSIASASTGPLSNNTQPLTNIPASADPQVDTVLILATADGNDQTTLYLVGSVANGSAAFTDTVPDSVLITQPLYQNTDAFGVLHGIANNNPPPPISFPVKHKGRIYGSIGQALFFSKNIDEVTTANGLITSKYEEAWPAVNQFDVSEQAETIQGLLSDGETLWIATERNIRRLIGDSPSNFQKPEVQFNEVGLLNQDVWKVVFAEGQPVGTMWLTPDFRLMESDFNTYRNVGRPIQDVLNSINPAATSTIHAQYVSKGPADYYMLYIPTGTNTSPDTICVYSLSSRTWFIWQPTDQVVASLFFFDVSGAPRWLFASTAGPFYEWTSGTFQDRINNNPVSYPVTIQTSWLDLGDYNLRKFVNQIIPTTADQTSLTIAVEAASNELDFISPLSVVPATTVTPAAIPTDVFVPLASGPSHSRAFRFTFVSPPSTVANVLTGFAIECGSFHRY